MLTARKIPMSRLTSLTLAVAVSATLLTMTAPEVCAQSRSLEEGPIVRRQLLYRSNRFELTPSLAHTLNDSYRRAAFLNLGTNYHLTNDFSLGLHAGWGLSYNTNILSEIEATSPSVARELAFAETTLLMNFHLGWVPYYGKFNFLDTTTVNFDLHLLGGLGAALVTSESDDLSGFKFGPAIGIGMRFFFDGDTALTLEVIDHMYSQADAQRSGERVEESFGHTVLVSVGISFFVTGDLRVSR